MTLRVAGHGHRCSSQQGGRRCSQCRQSCHGAGEHPAGCIHAAARVLEGAQDGVVARHHTARGAGHALQGRGEAGVTDSEMKWEPEDSESARAQVQASGSERSVKTQLGVGVEAKALELDLAHRMLQVGR